jgi:hypothetical protein
MATFDQVAEVLFQRISTDVRQFDGIANRDASMLTGKFDDLHYSFAFNLLFKSPDLLSQ